MVDRDDSETARRAVAFGPGFAYQGVTLTPDGHHLVRGSDLSAPVVERQPQHGVGAHLDVVGHVDLEGFVKARGFEPKPAQRALADRLHEMPALILVCATSRPPLESRAMQVSFYGSILPAAWSLMLALRARGLGATWTTLHLVHEEEAAQALGIPDGVTQTVLLPVGWMKGARLRPAARRPARDVTFWNRWGER